VVTATVSASRGLARALVVGPAAGKAFRRAFTVLRDMVKLSTLKALYSCRGLLTLVRESASFKKEALVNKLVCRINIGDLDGYRLLLLRDEHVMDPDTILALNSKLSILK